jgi:hypothetical protein
LLWQYRDADPEFGHMQSKELEDHLNGVLRGYPVEILRGENNPMQVRRRRDARFHMISGSVMGIPEARQLDLSTY